jgi:hypothetical protein
MLDDAMRQAETKQEGERRSLEDFQGRFWADGRSGDEITVNRCYATVR